ncbi:MAG: GNAT family N-acetyltransferase [Planctomycetota bacterium]
MDESPRCWTHHDLSDEQATAIAELMVATWPNPDKDVAVRAQVMQSLGAMPCPSEAASSRSFVLCDGGKVVAHASMQPREIETQSGMLWVLGLAGVCADASLRGKGLGKRIVQAALAMIDDGLAPFSLFQTSREVRPFYERLGACLVENPIVDSTADDPQSCPFWDNVAMRYPATDGWPQGTIDLRGPGY